MHEGKTNVLVVEDDAAVRNLIGTALGSHGYAFVTATTGGEAIRTIVSSPPHIVLLDLGLPDIDGVDVITKVRTWSQVPIIVVSARSDDIDKIGALDAGADDYLSKPFSVGELLARIRTAERHLNYQIQEEPRVTTFDNGDLHVDYVAGTVQLAGEELHLTPIEYRLLCLLARNVGRVLTHQFILREVWGGAQEGDLASLRVFMGTLRKKIEQDTSKPRYIQTHVGVGYRMIRV
jgi:two-component system KDP operon response regulator KdpE